MNKLRQVNPILVTNIFYSFQNPFPLFTLQDPN